MEEVFELLGGPGGVFVGLVLLLQVFPAALFWHSHGGRCLFPPCCIQLLAEVYLALGVELVQMLQNSVVYQLGQGVVTVAEVLQAHGADLLSVAGAVGVVEGVVFQRNHQILSLEMHSLEGQRGVLVLALVVFLVVGAVVKMEGKVVLALGHLDHAAVRHRNAGVALSNSMVIHLDPVHHAGGFVPVLYAEDIALDAVVEGSGGDFYLRFCTADIVPHGVYLVDGVGDQAVRNEEGAHGDENGDDDHGKEHPEEGNARCLDGGELELLAHLPKRHHGAEQCCQRNGQRQCLAASPHEELQDHLEFQAFANQFIYIQPKELKDQYECDNRQDRQKRSHERLQ